MKKKEKWINLSSYRMWLGQYVVNVKNDIFIFLYFYLVKKKKKEKKKEKIYIYKIKNKK